VAEGREVDLVALAREGGERLMPAHRIDRVTSGAVLLARTAGAHADLARQFRARAVEKAYLAITRPGGLPERGSIDLPLGPGRKGRVRVAAPRASIRLDETAGRWSVAPSDVFAGPSYPSRTAFTRLW